MGWRSSVRRASPAIWSSRCAPPRSRPASRRTPTGSSASPPPRRRRRFAPTRRLRAAEAELDLARTPVIALTANAFDEDREACLAAGMDGFLAKPLDRERLAEALAVSRRSLAA